jgi:hypothetical protein
VVALIVQACARTTCCHAQSLSMQLERTVSAFNAILDALTE